MNVAVFGAGKLGSPMAALFASAGHDVYLIDKNRMVVESVLQRKAPVEETGLQDLFDKSGHRINGVFWEDAAESCRRCEFVFVIVPTPSLPSGEFSNEYVKDSMTPIAQAISQGARLTVVVTSTVSPGAMSTDILPHLERLSGACAGAGFDLVYNPEFIALGSVIYNMEHPDFLLIGCDIPDGAKALEGFYLTTYSRLWLRMPAVAKMNYVNAEISKLAVNCFTTTKISYANGLADLCERLPSADAKVVCDAIGLDSRIGRKYLQPATAFGGECFPRDCRAMIAVGKRVEVGCPIPEATDEVNHRQIVKLKDLTVERQPKAVAVLGLSFKTDTTVSTESAGVRLVKMLRVCCGIDGSRIRVHDPMAKWSGDGVTVCSTATEAIADADVVVIATNWPEYSSLTPYDFAAGARIIDCWRSLKFETAGSGIEVIVPGRNRQC